MPAAQVMTGVVSPADLAAARLQPGFQAPDYLMASFGDLLDVQRSKQLPQSTAP
jgi:hypothetical protein